MTRLAHLPPTRVTEHRPPPARPSDTRLFLSEVLHHPHQLGAISPTGARLAAHAAALIPAHTGPQVVVELGPGGGAITDSLHARLPAGSTLLAIELNRSLVSHLRRTRPWLRVVHGDAADLPQLLAATTNRPADLVISALPWSLINDQAQQRILTGVADVLNPTGTFATVVTAPVRLLPAVRRFHDHLRQVFAVLTRTATVWGNVPPAHLLVARNPHQPPAHPDALAAGHQAWPTAA